LPYAERGALRSARKAICETTARRSILNDSYAGCCTGEASCGVGHDGGIEQHQIGVLPPPAHVS
jgi:hypothetical protein